MSHPLIEVDALTVTVPGRARGSRAVILDDVSLTLDGGGTLGLVGESGSGKSMTALAIMGLLPPGARVETGAIRLDGDDLVGRSKRELQRLRGRTLSMVLQDPMTALDPAFTIGAQLREPLRQHRGLRGPALGRAAVAALESVHVPSAAERVRAYPHQFSGGMRQRVTSAIALAGEPRLLIADEPTTALDVTTQARYLALLRELRERTGFALLFVSHDLMVVRAVCEQVLVMYAGQVVESGETASVFTDPRHPYTRALVREIPAPGSAEWLVPIEGQAPDPLDHVEGCRFAARCPLAEAACRESVPPLTPRAGGGTVRCFRADAEG
ncbi:ABC transporter ATP-binding protein [Jiangella alkaliphila]|uniref:Peptide/nickel transport system ATP-binding protein n=1 Tax=Jiangella alkaliphila TaxID=419479 RepID=A0A1H2LFC3_9ACTN|nr:ABC transporter ATP-binding protein [Jiangella alkaliphila]SDU79106.1 peptide/nickel transport system ATP-binding protein [Jiangella alkaliphila]